MCKHHEIRALSSHSERRSCSSAHCPQYSQSQKFGRALSAQRCWSSFLPAEESPHFARSAFLATYKITPLTVTTAHPQFLSVKKQRQTKNHTEAHVYKEISKKRAWHGEDEAEPGPSPAGTPGPTSPAVPRRNASSSNRSTEHRAPARSARRPRAPTPGRSPLGAPRPLTSHRGLDSARPAGRRRWLGPAAARYKAVGGPSPTAPLRPEPEAAVGDAAAAAGRGAQRPVQTRASSFVLFFSLSLLSPANPPGSRSACTKHLVAQVKFSPGNRQGEERAWPSACSSNYKMPVVS